MVSFKKIFILITFLGLIMPVFIWAQETPLLTLQHQLPPGAQGTAILAVKISPDGTKLLAAGYGVKLWDLNTGQELLFILGFGNYVQSAAFSWDGKYIVTGDWLRNIKIFDSQSGKLVKEFQDPETTDPTGDFVFGVAFSPDGKWVLSSQRQKTDLWDVATGQMIRHFTMIANVGTVDLLFLPDGVRAVIISETGIAVFNVNSGEIIQSLALGGASITPDFQKIITAQGGFKVWDLNTGKNLYSSPILKAIKYLSVLPDAEGYKVAYSTEAGTIQVDQLGVNTTLSHSPLKTFAKVDNKDLYRVLFSHDGKKIIMNSIDTVYVYDSSVLTSAAPGAEGYK